MFKILGRVFGPAGQRSRLPATAAPSWVADRIGRPRHRNRPSSSERRELIRLNKVADAAQTVRREFCRDLLAAKTKATVQKMTAWAVDQILARDRAVTGWLNDHSISSAPLADILGSETPMAVVAAATPPTLRTLMVWAYVVAAHEFDYPRDAHRSPHHIGRAGYLRHLVDLGYTPAETDRARPGGSAPRRRRPIASRVARRSGPSGFGRRFAPPAHPGPSPPDT